MPSDIRRSRSVLSTSKLPARRSTSAAWYAPTRARSSAGSLSTPSRSSSPSSRANAPIWSARGHRLPASYANFYIANRVVCVPTFGDPNDRRALAVLRRLFPKRKVMGIRCEHLVEGMGTLHCLSQQLPA